MPQYAVGHLDRIAAIERMVERILAGQRLTAPVEAALRQIEQGDLEGLAGVLVADVGQEREHFHPEIFAIVRYHGDIATGTPGTLDTSFNGSGKVITDFGAGNDSAISVAIDSAVATMMISAQTAITSGFSPTARMR